MAERDWYWWLEREPTEVPQFFRIEIRVAQSEQGREQPLYTLVAFLSADLASEPEVEAGAESGGGSETPSTPGQEGGNAGG